MERVIFNSGYELTTDDLEAMQEFPATQIKERLTEIFNRGISGLFGNYVTAGGAANSIKILALNAYDGIGEKIEILTDQDNLAPDTTDFTTLISSGGAWVPSINYIIVARYIEIDSTSVIHPITGISAYSRKDPSYTLHALRRSGATIDSFGANDVKLARVVVSAGGVPTVYCNIMDPIENFPVTDYCRLEADRVNTEIGATNPDFYEAGIQLTIQDHINSKGSGTVGPTNPHGLTTTEVTGNIDGSRINDNTLNASKIVDATITGAKIAPTTIAAGNIVPITITAAEIAAVTITGAKIAPTTITQDKLDPTLLAAFAIPVGTINAYVGLTAPSGWLLCTGVSTAGYPLLAALVGANTPDLQGYFIRGYKAGTTENINVEQLGAFQGHRHSLYSQVNYGVGGGAGAYWQTGPNTVLVGGGDAVKEAITDGTHGAVTVASETRPLNKAFNFIIKHDYL